MGADMDDRKRQPLSFDEQVELLVGVTDFWEYSDSAKLTASYLDKRFGSTAISPAVLEAALNKVDLDDRGALMKTLFVARPADFRTKIVSLLKDTEVDYKYAAIIGLLRLDEKQALKELDDLCSRVSDGLVASPLDRDGDPLFELGNVSDDVIEFAPDRYVELLLSLRVNKAE